MLAEARREPEGWRSHAFGLEITSAFPLAGFPSRELGSAPGLPRLRLRLAGEEQLRAPFAQGGRPIGWRRKPDGEPIAPDVLAHPTAGFLMSSPSVGHFRVSRAGEEIECAPSDANDWRWQRYLVGRALPFAATLNGLEPWHAGAVALARGAIALVASAGVGKSTITAELMLRGGRFLADDVISVESTTYGPLVHPSPPLMSLRTGPLQSFADSELAQLGVPIGWEEDGLRVGVDRCECAQPLRVLYLLVRESPDRGGLRALAAPDPARLIGSTFNFAIRTPDRLSRQLEVAASIARHAEVVRAGVVPGADLRALGEEILEDARERMDARDDSP